MSDLITIAVLEDHQSVIDGYRYRLQNASDIQVVATIGYGEELELSLKRQPVDVLLLDINVPSSQDNPNPYPILHLIPRLLQSYPNMAVLVISMYAQGTMIRALMDAGVRGYILKDDRASIHELPTAIRTVASDGIYLSEYAYQQLVERPGSDLEQPLSLRQREALSLCAAYPADSTSDLARRMFIAPSTLRNLLSSAYLKLNVRSRTAAVAKARKLGLITSEPEPPAYR